MLRLYYRGVVRFLRISIFEFRCSSFFAAFWANVNVFAEGNLQRLEQAFLVKAKALSIGNIPDVSAKLSIGPKEIADRSKQLLDLIVLLDQLRHVAGRARGGNILQRLRGLGEEAN